LKPPKSGGAQTTLSPPFQKSEGARAPPVPTPMDDDADIWAENLILAVL